MLRLPLPAGPRRVLRRVFTLCLAPAIRRFEDDWLRVVTECLMTLALPDETLDLGDLFRSRQQEQDLGGLPFTREQTGAIRAGFVPAVRL